MVVRSRFLVRFFPPSFSRRATNLLVAGLPHHHPPSKKRKKVKKKSKALSHLAVGQDLPAPQARALPVHLHRLAEHLVQVVEGGLDPPGDHGGPRVEVPGPPRRGGEDVGPSRRGRGRRVGRGAGGLCFFFLGGGFFVVDCVSIQHADKESEGEGERRWALGGEKELRKRKEGKERERERGKERKEKKKKTSASSLRPLALRNAADEKKTAPLSSSPANHLNPLTDCREDLEIRNHERRHLEEEKELGAFKGGGERRTIDGRKG